MGGAHAGLVIEMRFAIAPIRERPVDINSNRVDIRRTPKRIEMKEDITGTVFGLMTKIFRPVSGIADIRLRSEDSL